MTDTRTAAELRAEAEALAALAKERETQVTYEQLKTMSPAQISAAQAQGRLASLLSNGAPTE